MRVHRLVAFLSFFAVLLVYLPNQVNSAQPDTFTFGAEVRLCDYTQNEASLDPGVDEFGSGAFCQIPVDGAEIEVSQQGGGVLGTCITESHPGPQGGAVNSYSLDGFSRNASYLFALDESTIPSGYEIESNPITLEIGDEIPGGGETFAVTFRGNIGELPDSPTTESNEFSAAIVEGSCGESLTTTEPLESSAEETGSPVGLPNAMSPLVSITTVDASLDILNDEPHSVVVNRDGEAILCGEIGGVDNDDGVLHIVLSPAVGENFIGIATLSYNNSNPDQTDVELYVIE